MQYSGALQIAPTSSASATTNAAATNQTYPSPPESNTDAIKPAEPESNTRALDTASSLATKTAPVQNQPQPTPTKEQSQAGSIAAPHYVTPGTTGPGCEQSHGSPASASTFDRFDIIRSPASASTFDNFDGIRSSNGANITQESRENGEQIANGDVSLLRPQTYGPQAQDSSTTTSPPALAGRQHLHGQDGGHTNPQPNDPNPSPSDSHRDKRVCTAHPLPPRPLPVKHATPRTTPAGQTTPHLLQHQPATMSPERTAPVSLSMLVDSLEAWKAGMPNMAQVRIAHMQDACRIEDMQYIALHQIYAIRTVSPQLLRFSKDFGQSQDHGLEILGMLLVSNRTLPLEFVAKSAEFPTPLPKGLENWPAYAAFMPIAVKTLELLSTKWDGFLNCVMRRLIPPLIDEMEIQFSIKSPTLLKTIFTACYRRLSPNEPDKWRQRYTNIYSMNERFYLERWSRNRTTPVSVEEREAHNQRIFIMYYDVLLEEHPNGHMGLPHHPTMLAPTEPTAPYRPSPQPTQPQGVQATFEQNAGVRQSTNHGYPIPATGSYTSGSPPAVQPQHYRSGNVYLHNRMLFSTSSSATPVTGYASAQPTSVHPSPQLNNGGYVGFAPSAGTSQAQQAYRPAAAVTANSTQAQTQQQASRIWPHQPPNGTIIAAHRAQRAAATTAPVQPQVHSTNNQAVHQQFVLQSSPSSATQTFQSVPQTPPQAPLFPPHGYHHPVPAVPNPTVTGLHEAHLMISTRNLDQDGKENPARRLYQFVHGFMVPPFCLGAQASTFRFTINIKPEDIQSLAKVLPTEKDRPLAYGVMDGSVIFQLRCARVNGGSEPLPEAKWMGLDCSWPEALYIHVNGTEHYIRRKLHNGKDLPVNITSSLRAGSNNVELTYIRGPEEFTKMFFAVALETVAVREHTRVCKSIARLLAPACVNRIVQRLNQSSVNDDDDLCVVDEHMNINLVDPFMARIFNIPVRGRGCAHADCFDLETYLETRRAKTVRGNGMAEAWKCPICEKDARPPNLYIDKFLLDVREELARRNQLETVRAILVKRDGSWEAKTERQTDSQNRTLTPSSTKFDGVQNGSGTSQHATLGSGPSLAPPEVIELD